MITYSKLVLCSVLWCSNNFDYGDLDTSNKYIHYKMNSYSDYEDEQEENIDYKNLITNDQIITYFQKVDSPLNYRSY